MLRLTKLKPFNSSLSTHQLIQRCIVSGTAKGKSKIKAGQTLKRSKITIKKQPGPESKPIGPMSRDRQDRENLYEQCLNALTPLRYTPKLRAREAEREKMGLISKGLKREIKLMKKKNDKLKVSDTPTIIGTSGLDFITLGLVDVEKLPKYELSVEDERRSAKEYSRVMMRKHRARQATKSTLLRMKMEAIEASPECLGEAALVPDMSPFSMNWFMATLTPPHEGYIEKVRDAAKKISDTEKIR